MDLQQCCWASQTPMTMRWPVHRNQTWLLIGSGQNGHTSGPCGLENDIAAFRISGGHEVGCGVFSSAFAFFFNKRVGPW